MNGIIIRLSGVTYGDAQENIKRFGCEAIGSFAIVREPENPHDRYAIKVGIGNFHLGYIPRGVAKNLAPMMDARKSFIAYFVSKNVSTQYDTEGYSQNRGDNPCVLSK